MSRKQQNFAALRLPEKFHVLRPAERAAVAKGYRQLADDKSQRPAVRRHFAELAEKWEATFPQK